MQAKLVLMLMLGLTMAITVLQATADDVPAHVHPAPRGLSKDSATLHNYRPLRRHKSYRERSRLHKKPKHAPSGSPRRLKESSLLENGYYDNDYDCGYYDRRSHCHRFDDDSSYDDSDSYDDSYDRGHDDWYGGNYGLVGVYGYGPSYGYSGYGAYGGFDPFFYGYENAEAPVEAASTPGDTVEIEAESAAPSKKPKSERKPQQKPSTVKKAEKKAGKA